MPKSKITHKIAHIHLLSYFFVYHSKPMGLEW